MFFGKIEHKEKSLWKRGGKWYNTPYYGTGGKPWTESLYLPPEHLRGIFSLSGIVMPALLLRGRVAGRWKRTGKKLAITAFEPLSREDKERIAGSAEELWSGVKLEFQ